jgi:hypothetical protein
MARPGVVGLFWLLMAAAPAWASGAVVSGVVKDDSGATLPGVAIELEAIGVELARSVSTDPAGAFEFAGLLEGAYRLACRLPGFATSVKTITLGPDDNGRVDVILRLTLTADVLVTSRRTFRNLTDIDEPLNGLLGLASAGSEGVVTSSSVEQRPVYRAGQIFEAVPGVVISQHSGEGKANQYYVRGFNIDHGTDLATFVAGVPVNMPTHGHGQGYSDNNFLIPELVSGVQYHKGTYSAEEGDFSAAGSINVNYLNLVDEARGGAERLRASALHGFVQSGPRPPSLCRRGPSQRRTLDPSGRLSEVQRRSPLLPR